MAFHKSEWRNVPGSIRVRDDAGFVQTLGFVECRLVSVFSRPPDLVTAALTIRRVALRARDPRSTLSLTGHHQLDEPLRSGVLSRIHVHGHFVQGAPVARQRADRDFRGVASSERRAVLTVALGGLNNHAHRCENASGAPATARGSRV